MLPTLDRAIDAMDPRQWAPMGADGHRCRHCHRCHRPCRGHAAEQNTKSPAASGAFTSGVFHNHVNAGGVGEFRNRGTGAVPTDHSTSCRDHPRIWCLADQLLLTAISDIVLALAAVQGCGWSSGTHGRVARAHAACCMTIHCKHVRPS